MQFKCVGMCVVSPFHFCFPEPPGILQTGSVGGAFAAFHGCAAISWSNPRLPPLAAAGMKAGNASLLFPAFDLRQCQYLFGEEPRPFPPACSGWHQGLWRGHPAAAGTEALPSCPRRVLQRLGQGPFWEDEDRFLGLSFREIQPRFLGRPFFFFFFDMPKSTFSGASSICPPPRYYSEAWGVFAPSLLLSPPQYSDFHLFFSSLRLLDVTLAVSLPLVLLLSPAGRNRLAIFLCPTTPKALLGFPHHHHPQQ